jgi:uncharacterized protein YqeY
MKDKNKARKDTLSSLIGAVKKAAIDKMCKDNITEAMVDEVILKEKKTVQEMIDTCPAERTELLQEYQDRMSVIDEFAPKIVTDEKEIKNMIYRLLATVDIQQNGKSAIMKAVMPKLKGKVDMKVANKILNEILNKSGEA